MPRKLPPYVERWPDRHGKIRIYYRRAKGSRIPLRGLIGSDEFLADYQAALAGQITEKVKRRQPDPPGSIGALIVSYMRSAAYVELRDTTKTGYSSRIEALRTGHGHRSVAGLTRERILTGILGPYAGKPGARLAILKMLRVLIHYAIDIGWLKHDPSLGIKRPKTNEIRAWTEAEIATFERRHPTGTKPRLAFALMLYTGQRRSDVHRMTWADVNRSMIRVVQQKTGEKLEIPIHSNLKALLSAVERSHVTILNTTFGRPFTVDGFSQWMRSAIKDAGLPLECQPHGLRKAAGRRLAEAGCSAREILSVLGHRTLEEAERYTRDASQPHLATSAVTRLEAHRTNTVAQTDARSLGKSRKGKEK